jgi:hypothetical protein
MTSRTTAFPAVASIQSSDSGPGAGIDSPSAQTPPLAASETVNRSESSDSYSNVMAVLNSKWHIRCRDGIQWILQSRDSLKVEVDGLWRGRSYCRTKEALFRVRAIHAGEINPTAAALAELTDWIEAPDLQGCLCVLG